jgi:hypothetical protein
MPEARHGAVVKPKWDETFVPSLQRLRLRSAQTAPPSPVTVETPLVPADSSPTLLHLTAMVAAIAGIAAVALATLPPSTLSAGSWLHSWIALP